MPHDPQASLIDMLIAARRAVRRLGTKTEDDYAQDTDLQWVLFSQLLILGEAANRIGRDEQREYPEIPWSSIIGMRNRLVHGYDSIDWVVVYFTVRDELPKLVERLEQHVEIT